MNKELICIGCPMGCMMTVSMDGGKILEVSGHSCAKGDKYAREEITNPTRIVTSTVKLSGAGTPLVPVKTKNAIPKGSIMACMKALRNVECKAPIAIGDVVYSDPSYGLEIVATKSVAANG